MDIKLFLTHLLDCNLEDYTPCRFKDLEIENKEPKCKYDCAECVLSKIKELMNNVEEVK